ncbi:MAG: 6,7-dimethyl-8-ribityllumazine synthase [bacterium]|nr:6,7-dimethyl-8-ribityllumazine synthase [bacterium]
MKIYEGEFSASGKKFGIIASRFNSFITDKLIDGAVDCLTRHNAKSDAIEIFKVPGAFEIPQVLKVLVSGKKRFDGIICLGAIIRGETTHFDLISKEVTKGIAQVSLQTTIPIGFGIVAADTVEQAIDRAGGKHGNKGESAALTVIEQINLIAKL